MADDARERFLRNHDERIRIMRARAIVLEREGRYDDAQRIRKIADSWDGICEQMRLKGGE